MGKSKTIGASSALLFGYYRVATRQQLKARRTTSHSTAQPEEVQHSLKKSRKPKRQGHGKHSPNEERPKGATRLMLKAPVIPFNQRIASVGPPRHLIRYHRHLSRE